MDVKFITCPRSKLDDIVITNGQLIYLGDEGAAFYDMSNTRYPLSSVRLVNGLPLTGAAGLLYIDQSVSPNMMYLWDETEEEFVSMGGQYIAGTGLSLSGSTFNHSNSVTAGTASGDADKTLTWSDTFTVPSVTYDAQGHVTASDFTTMTMPANPNTHWTTRLHAGTVTAQNAVTTNGNTHLTISDDSAVRTSVTLVGSGDTTVTSDANGVVTINTTSAAGGVTGVKGNSESTYRTGNVNITKANIGLGNVPNPKVLTGTLLAGHDEITFTDAAITTNSTLLLTCSDASQGYESATCTTGTVTYTGFDTSSTDLSMKLYVL